MENRSTSRGFMIRAWCARVSSNVRMFIGFSGKSATDDEAPEETARGFGNIGPFAKAGIENNEPTFSLEFEAMDAPERQAENGSESPATRQIRSAKATGDLTLSSATGS